MDANEDDFWGGGFGAGIEKNAETTEVNLGGPWQMGENCFVILSYDMRGP
jgi:hypothetical protein